MRLGWEGKQTGEGSYAATGWVLCFTCPNLLATCLWFPLISLPTCHYTSRSLGSLPDTAWTHYRGSRKLLLGLQMPLSSLPPDGTAKELHWLSADFTFPHVPILNKYIIYKNVAITEKISPQEELNSDTLKPFKMQVCISGPHRHGGQTSWWGFRETRALLKDKVLTLGQLTRSLRA